MEASVSQEGAQATQETAAPEGTQPTPSQSQVPEGITQRLDEFATRFDQFEPLLQNLQPQQEQEPQPGMEDFIEPETGYVLDPEGLQNYINQQAQTQAQELLGPLQSRLDQHDQHFTQEAFADLTHQYPQLADEGFQAQFVPRVEQAALQIVQSMGLGPDAARKLALSPQFVANQYLAGLAREQAQQGVPAGDQGVHIEGGTGTPGHAQVDAKQEWLGGMQLGAQSGPFGRPVGDL